MRTKKYLLGLLALGLFALSLAACGGGASDIQGIEWQWVSLVETQPASQSLVPDSENYTIVFNADDTVVIKADCKMVLGDYTVSRSDLTIESGISTMAYCGEDSADVFYLGLLAQVASFELKDGRLELGLADEAGTMGFQDGGKAK